jgi:beta-phosphoglucomutase-like phosphatase (HAD superfamily)
MLAFVEARGLSCAVATSSDIDYATFSLRHGGLDGRFPVIVTGEEVTHGKPAPDIYLEAARRLGVPPASCVALEDSEAGILAARAAGMRALLIPDGAAPTISVCAWFACWQMYSKSSVRGTAGTECDGDTFGREG